MEEKYYKIGRNELFNLLLARLTLETLEYDGVDSWTHYLESRDAVISEYLNCDIGKAVHYSYDYVVDKLINEEYEEVE